MKKFLLLVILLLPAPAIAAPWVAEIVMDDLESVTEPVTLKLLDSATPGGPYRETLCGPHPINGHVGPVTVLCPTPVEKTHTLHYFRAQSTSATLGDSELSEEIAVMQLPTPQIKMQMTITFGGP